MEQPKLRLVEAGDEQDLAPVIPIRRGLGYLATMQSLPDNVFVLREPSPEPPEAA
jgi:hypothetical protein